MRTLPQLLCLPPAGGGPSLYHPWTRQYRDRVEIYPVSLPGREARIAEPLPRTLDELADLLADQLAPCLAHRYAVFGYSMGAVLAYELGRRWARWGLPAPEMFFILACNPPDRLASGREPIHTLEDTAFWQTLVDIGGTPREILNSTEAMTVFEPILRNDFRICETYQHQSDGTRLNCSAHAFVADRDKLVDAKAVLAWEEFIGGEFAMHSLQGNHMLERNAFGSLLDRLLRLWPDLDSQRALPSSSRMHVTQHGPSN